MELRENRKLKVKDQRWHYLQSSSLWISSVCQKVTGENELYDKKCDENTRKSYPIFNRKCSRFTDEEYFFLITRKKIIP